MKGFQTKKVGGWVGCALSKFILDLWNLFNFAKTLRLVKKQKAAELKFKGTTRTLCSVMFCLYFVCTPVLLLVFSVYE